jgi:hypothetical protein
MDRYFVVVMARNADALRALQKFDLDVFAQTAKQAASPKQAATDKPSTNSEFPFSIEGLLSMEEVEALVKDGYRVLVEDPAEKRARGASEVGDFSQWLDSMQAAVTQERAAAAADQPRDKSRRKK